MSRPGARVVIDGKDVTPLLTDPRRPLLVSLTFTDHRGLKADTLEIELDDGSDFHGPKPGTPIQLWLGYVPDLVFMGAFTVDQWTKRGGEGGRLLHISAKAAELTGTIRQARMRSYHRKTISEIAAQIAGRNGLALKIDAEIGARLIDHIDQQHESDLHFLTRLAGRNGATFKIGDGKLILAKKGSTLLPGGDPRPVLQLAPRDVSSWTATSAHRGDYPAVVASYSDRKHGQRRTVTSGAGAVKHRLRTLFATKNEAHRAAFAAEHDLKRGVGNFETEGPGIPSAFAEMLVRASGFAQSVDGEYVVKTATHVYENRGYRTVLTMETLGDPTNGQGDDPTDELAVAA